MAAAEPPEKLSQFNLKKGLSAQFFYQFGCD
jgi:hypothetical protein